MTTSPVLRSPCRAAIARPVLRPLASALICLGLMPCVAQVLPTGASVAAGSVAIGAPSALANGGLALGISQTSARAVVNWQTFSIGTLDRVDIVQPATTSALLGRVTGVQASVIAGRLSTTLAGNPAATGGAVYLINPNGVVFANGALVSVGGLVASTLDIEGPSQASRNAAFMAGGVVDPATARAELNFAAGASGSSFGIATGVTVAPGARIVAGGATAPGTVVLLGGEAANGGTIEAPRGSVTLAAAGAATLVIDPVGDGLTTLRITSPATLGTLVGNTGLIEANGGRIALQASSSASETVVRQSGVLRARSIDTRTGQIVLGAGDGSSGNTIGIEGGQIDATGGATAPGGQVLAGASRLDFSAGSIDAGGVRGGTVALVGSQAVTMAPAASIAANGASGRGGEVVLGASGSAGLVHVSGTIEARGATDGGRITTTAATVEIGRPASIDAGGGTGANGKWLLTNADDLLVTAARSESGDATYSGEASFDAFGVSRVADVALGTALGRSTDITIDNRIVDNFHTDGVRFEAGSQVLQAQAAKTALTVDSTRSISMDAGSAIRATAGTLAVDFDANASGAPLLATGPAAVDYGDVERVGQIVIDRAVIATRGGDIRFYGQRDPIAGRAVGGYSGSGNGTLDGITINAATLDTCAGGDGCTGAIALRGQGATQSDFSDRTSAGTGIRVQGATLRSGSGALTLDGVGGLAASGVVVGRAAGTASLIESRGGDVVLTGRSRGLVAGDLVGALDSTGNAGVVLNATTVQAAGNVTVTGSGADLGTLQADARFIDRTRQLSGSGGGTAFAASNGVAITDSDVTAGTGRTLSVSGSAGSRGFTVENAASAAAVTQDAVDARAVDVLATTANGLQAAGGQVRVAGGAGDVSLLQVEPLAGPVLLAAVVPTLAVGTVPRALVSVANANGPGGTIVITGRNVAVQASNTVAQLDASGAASGGSIDIRATAASGVVASGIVAVDAGTQLLANATVSGDGGRVTVIADDTLRAFGSLQARGAGTVGNGGSIETSGAAFDLRGVRVDASAGSAVSQPGTWRVDPHDVAITPGSATGSLPANPFTPLAASAIQDGDINRALDAGTSVTLTTGTGGTPTQGDIAFATGVDINHTTATAPVTLRLDAQRSIRSVGSGVVIQSSGQGGPLNVVFNADANASGPTVGGGQISYDGAIYTNGGSVTMNADWSAAGSGDSAIHLTGIVDTRVGRVDTGAGGDVRLTGRTSTPVANEFSSQPAVWLDGASISTASGNVVVDGLSSNNTGVRINGNAFASSTQGIATTSGAVTVTGRGTDKPAGGSSALVASTGVLVDGARVVTTGGAIALRGQVDDTARTASTSAGVRIASAARIATTGGGDIELTGSAARGGVGLALQGATATSTVPGASVNGSRNVLLRAGNDGSADAIAITAPVTATDTIDLHPGGVDRSGTAADRVAVPIALGGTGGMSNGFAVSAGELGLLAADTVVAGSSAQAADIVVVGAIATPAALTLQNDAGGSIRLDAAVSVARLGLLSAGTVSQGAAAPITADTLLARSTRGDVALENAANNVAVLGGGAAGRFGYADADALRIGATTARSFDSTGNLPRVVGMAELAAGQVVVRTSSGDLTLATGLRATSSADLVAGARFQNPTGQGISASAWRIWADTWNGETRGGLSGSGTLPNLYNCAYAGLCAVALPASGNQFIYRLQPTATVAIDDATRVAGAANPVFGYRTSGLILGDGAASIAGTPRTSATAASPAGTYAIDGAFASPAGYAVNVVAGTLTVTSSTSPPPPLPSPVVTLYKLPLSEVAADTSNVYTYTFDRNLGRPPVCFAIGSLEGDRGADAADFLAREWTRVRSRPNLSSCVSTERRNGCSDF